MSSALAFRYWDTEPVDPALLEARGVRICTSSGQVVATGADIFRISVSDVDVIRERAAAKGEDPDEAERTIPPDRLWLRRPLVEGTGVRRGNKKKFNKAKGKQPYEAIATVAGAVKTIGVWWDDYCDGGDGTPLQAELWLQPRGSDYVYLANSDGRLTEANMAELFPRRPSSTYSGGGRRGK